MNTFEIGLFVIFVATLLSVLSVVLLRSLVPTDSALFAELFTYGDVPQYHRVLSLRVHLIVPWGPIPDFTAVGPVGRYLFIFARALAAVAGLTLIAMVLSGLFLATA